MVNTFQSFGWQIYIGSQHYPSLFWIHYALPSIFFAFYLTKLLDDRTKQPNIHSFRIRTLAFSFYIEPLYLSHTNPPAPPTKQALMIRKKQFSPFPLSYYEYFVKTLKLAQCPFFLMFSLHLIFPLLHCKSLQKAGVHVVITNPINFFPKRSTWKDRIK